MCSFWSRPHVLGNTCKGSQVKRCFRKSRQQPAKCVQGMGLHMRHVVALMFLLLLHTGEARNPGPDTQGHTWTLGTFNPSGLNGKHQILTEHLAYGDIWAVSETHLSSRALQTFRRGLACSSSPFRYVVGGHPAPVRKHSEHSGSWTGVATISRFPTRQVPVVWPEDAFQTSRVQVTTTLCNDLWISGGIVYGEPPGVQHPNAKQHNEQLLCATIEAVMQHRGCRFVAGDWNFQIGNLEAFALLERYGFKDLQTIAHERWGREPQATCKGVTRKDFMYISPELRDFLVDVKLDHDVWSDHSVLAGVFKGGPAQIRSFHWRMPRQFPWPNNLKEQNLRLDTDFHTKDPTCMYLELWKQVENQAETLLSSSVSGTVHTSMKGRGATLDTVVKKGAFPFSPLKQSRKGDVLPHFHGASIQHAQWFRQLRRLQAYCRYARVHASDNDFAHGAQLWRSILQAKGFSQGFSTWWQAENGTLVDNAPTLIPVVPPPLQVAESIYHSFQLEVRKLESHLNSSLKKHGIKRREEQAHLIFKDIKAVPPARVDVLLNSQQATILDVSREDFCVTLDRELELDHTKPCVISGRKFNIVYAEAEWVYLEDIEGVQPLQVLTQSRFVGNTEEMFQEFEAEWTKRWNRHENVSASQWHSIIEFAKHTLPFRPCELEAITPQQICAEAARKKKTSATGPDGVSLHDIQSMPLCVLQQLCDMLNRAEQTGEWPKQALVGKVASLAKTESPSKVSQYRPITIYSQIYRLWGSIRSKQLLVALDSICPPDLMGNRPGRHAMQLWMYVQWRVEVSHLTGQELAGVTADIQKAFNHLPREVVFAAGLCVGVPNRVLVGWAGALTQMSRRFEIRESLGPAISSCTGCPEGCSMSCVGMLLLNMLFHHWISKQCTLAQPLSYVDDWQILTNEPSKVPEIKESLETFTAHVDLLLDTKKTFSWSTGKVGRRHLRNKKMKPQAQARGLGAQMQFTKQHRSKVLLDRVNELTTMWPKLRQSLSPYFLKVRVLSRAAWPKGLHAVGATHLGLSRFGALRSGAMRGIEATGSGCNSWVHLGMIESPEADPQFWSIKETIRGIRLCQNEAQMAVLFEVATHEPDMLPHGGPTRALLNRIHCLGWSLHAGGIIRDSWGEFHLFSVSYPELVLRAAMSWKYVVASKVVGRSCFDQLHRADTLGTRAFLSSLSVSEQGLFRKVLNGAAFTNDILYHFTDSGSTTCCFCNAQDSRMHRFWHCPAFVAERRSLPPDIVDMVPDLPACLTQSGWAMQAPTQDLWWQTLMQVELSLPTPLQTKWLDEAGWIDVFTDGSCHCPKHVDLRFASWAVCRAASQFHLNESTVIAAGGVPGILQSAYRAELFAVVQALQWAVQHQVKLRIWSDCQGVVNKVKKLTQGSWTPNINSCHYDLWVQVQEALLILPQGTCRITKVAAHTDVQEAKGPLEQWAFMHNALADRAARLANQCRPQQFWEVQQRHSQQVMQVNRISSEIQKVILAVSKRAVMRAALEDELSVEPLEAPLKAHRLPELSEQDGPVAMELTKLAPLQAAERFGHRLTALTAAWLQEGFQQATHGHENRRWIAWIQLYIDFQQRTGDVGPHYEKGWKDPAVRPLLKARQVSFKKRCSWFVQLVKSILKCNQIHPTGSVTRPDSVMLALHTTSIYIAWPVNRTQSVERWLHNALSRAATRDGSTLKNLPFAKQLDGQTSLNIPIGPLGR